MSIRIDVDGVVEGLTLLREAIDPAVQMLATQGAQKMENFAKENRRWTDRTGQARQRLKGSTSQIPNGYRITIAHGVDYGIWLELAHEKRFSILPETLEYVSAFEIMPGFNKLIERLGEL